MKLRIFYWFDSWHSWEDLIHGNFLTKSSNKLLRIVIQPLQQAGLKTLTEMVNQKIKNWTIWCQRSHSCFIITFDFLISESLIKKIVPILKSWNPGQFFLDHVLIKWGQPLIRDNFFKEWFWSGTIWKWGQYGCQSGISTMVNGTL